jgi:hypothetical protein
MSLWAIPVDGSGKLAEATLGLGASKVAKLSCDLVGIGMWTDLVG